MALHWIVESRLELVTAVAEGDVDRRDLEAYLAMAKGANLLAWRKLIDLRASRITLTSQDVNELGVRFRAAAGRLPVGPLAFAMPEAPTPELVRLLGFLAAAKRPMRLFNDIGPARRWIATTNVVRQPNLHPSPSVHSLQ